MNISKMNCFKIIILPLALILVWAAGNIPSLLNLEPLYTHADWKLSQYNVNYFDHGFIRRGLIGTIIFPIFNIDFGMSLVRGIILLPLPAARIIKIPKKL